MFRIILISSGILLFLSSCSSLKKIGTNFNKEKPQPETASSKKDVKFLDDISTDVQKGPVTQPKVSEEKPNKIQATNVSYSNNAVNTETEKVTFLQIKYALMLNTEIESVNNLKALKFIDEWYGTRYRLGGTTKSGIDCSAFTQLFFTTVYGIGLPRTSREQYSKSKKISRTHLREGDLVFFSTRGRISHVGIYLQNNKFVHASTSGGVMISDLFEDYWLRKFSGVGRIESEQGVVIK